MYTSGQRRAWFWRRLIRWDLGLEMKVAFEVAVCLQKLGAKAAFQADFQNIVNISASIQQILYNFGVSLLGSDGQGCVTILVGHVDIGVPLQQLLDHFSVATFHCHDQSCHGVLKKKP